METDAIERKLNRELLSAEPWTEKRVVYFLVQIRRILEQEKKLKKKYPALNFFCCWAVHSKAKGGGAERILKRFDDAHLYLAQSDSNSIPDQVIQTLGTTMSLRKFYTDVESFLGERNLPTSILEIRQRWLEFLESYYAIIQDCPFVLSG